LEREGKGKGSNPLSGEAERGGKATKATPTLAVQRTPESEEEEEVGDDNLPA